MKGGCSAASQAFPATHSGKQLLITDTSSVQTWDALSEELGLFSSLLHMKPSGQTSLLAVALKLNASTPSPLPAPSQGSAEQKCPKKHAHPEKSAHPSPSFLAAIAYHHRSVLGDMQSVFRPKCWGFFELEMQRHVKLYCLPSPMEHIMSIVSTHCSEPRSPQAFTLPLRTCSLSPRWICLV